MATADATTIGGAVRQRRLRGFTLRRGLQTTSPYAVLAALVLLMALRQPGYLSVFQFRLVTGNALPLILAAAGQTVVILGGGIDLSVGGIISVVTALGATHMHDSVTSIAAVAIALLLGGALAGILNGLLVCVLNIQPLIATLATWSIWGGLALVLLPSPGGNVPLRWIDLATASTAGLSNEFWLLLLVVVLWCVFLRMKTAVAIKAVGSSRSGAVLAGVSWRRTTISSYAFSGFAAAAAGLYLVSSTASGSPTIGDDYILPSIAAVAIGGARLLGGSARLSGAIAGAYILTVVNDVAFSFNLPSGWGTFAVGPLLILAVLIGNFGALKTRLLRR